MQVFSQKTNIKEWKFDSNSFTSCKNGWVGVWISQAGASSESVIVKVWKGESLKVWYKLRERQVGYLVFGFPKVSMQFTAWTGDSIDFSSPISRKPLHNRDLSRKFMSQNKEDYRNMYMLTKSKKYAKSVPYLQKELPDNCLSDFFHFLLKKGLTTKSSFAVGSENQSLPHHYLGPSDPPLTCCS